MQSNLQFCNSRNAYSQDNVPGKCHTGMQRQKGFFMPSPSALSKLSIGMTILIVLVLPRKNTVKNSGKSSTDFLAGYYCLPIKWETYTKNLSTCRHSGTCYFKVFVSNSKMMLMNTELFFLPKRWAYTLLMQERRQVQAYTIKLSFQRKMSCVFHAMPRS